MRFFFWLLVAAVAISLVYSAAQGIATYMDAARLSDEAVERERPNVADTMLQGRWRFESSDLARRVRDRLVRALGDAQIPVAADDVAVTEGREGELRVRVRWSQPLLTVSGEPYLLVPVSMTRNYTLEPSSGAARR